MKRISLQSMLRNDDFLLRNGMCISGFFYKWIRGCMSTRLISFLGLNSKVVLRVVSWEWIAKLSFGNKGMTSFLMLYATYMPNRFEFDIFLWLDWLQLKTSEIHVPCYLILSWGDMWWNLYFSQGHSCKINTDTLSGKIWTWFANSPSSTNNS